jgi:pantothenate kinase-related protein Tda10
MSTVSVFVTGATGSGKSAIAGEIEIALKAIGVDVTWEGGDDEKRLTHADWQGALEQYNPKVIIRELNVASIPPGRFGDGTLARSKAP